MAESDADIYYAVKASELRQLAWLTAQFHEALQALNLPDGLMHDLIVQWFETELENSRVVIDDD